MGGQACVFYGAAEFSRDLDLLVLIEPQQLERLRAGLGDLGAEPIAVPAFLPEHLLRGHAVHFRCTRPDVSGLRIDLMSKLRRVPSFEELWERRTTFEVAGEHIDVLSVADLVRAKKTQRDKDWPMIRRLMEQDYFTRSRNPAPERVEFWLRELRSPELLIEVSRQNPDAARREAIARPAVGAALDGDAIAAAKILDDEERAERLSDQEYWAPLKRELEQLRRSRHKSGGQT
jgi:hypothetical protein